MKYLLDRYYRLRLILHCNILRGVIFKIRRTLTKTRRTSYDKNLLVYDIYSIKKVRTSLIEYFTYQKNKNKKKQLIAIANDFLLGYVSIYGKRVNLKKYATKSFHSNRSKEEIYNKDIRFHWEIYRGKFLYNVGVAYVLTKDERYSKGLVEYVENWKHYSPIYNDKVRYNGMEASLQIINLMWVYWFVQESQFFTETFRMSVVDILIDNAEYIYSNYDITLYGLESNHGLTCCAGLVIASLLLPDYKRSKKWHRFGKKCLERGLKNQFNEGVNFESSSQYHRYTFEIILITLMALKGSKYDENFNSIEDKLKEIGNALLGMRHSNLQIPRIGDSDGGKVLYDFGTVNEFNTLEYLDAFTNGNSYKNYYETLPFIYVDKEKEFNLELKKSVLVGPYIVFKGKYISLLIVGHNIGTKGKGNHQHNDFLSFELYGRSPFIVDTWSYCYTGDSNLRNHDRSTSSHNSVMIDGEEIVKFNEKELFEMLGNVKTEILIKQNTTQKLVAQLSHNGYKKLKNGRQFHKRNFIIDKTSNSIKVIDRLSGNGNHLAVINFYIPKKYWKMKKIGNRVIFSNSQEEFILINKKCQIELSNGKISENFLNFVDSYHVILRHRYINSVLIETDIKYNKIMN